MNIRERRISWLEKLERNELVIIDGATGTELQRRGVPMDETAWCGAAVLTHPAEVRGVHEDYIRAGAEVVIANTFGSTRQMLEPAGYGAQVEQVNREAVELAIEARTELGAAHVAVAGSISAMPPGFDREAYLTPDDELESYREAAQALADAGCDLIALEMMEETEHAARAMQAAVETGLPIWLGVCCKKHESGKLVSFDSQNVALADTLDTLLPMGPTVVNVMHTNAHVVGEALELVRQRWDGPTGVYPESGYFTKPNWNFVDVIPPEELVREAIGWTQSGVRLLGGCCGTGPEHIQALDAARVKLAGQ